MYSTSCFYNISKSLIDRTYPGYRLVSSYANHNYNNEVYYDLLGLYDNYHSPNHFCENHNYQNQNNSDLKPAGFLSPCLTSSQAEQHEKPEELHSQLAGFLSPCPSSSQANQQPTTE